MTNPRLNAAIESYSDLVKINLGEHPARSILAELCTQYPGEGKSTLIDSVLPDQATDATTTEAVDLASREAFFNQASVDQTFESFKSTMTPYNKIPTARTISKPKLIEAGTYMSDQDFLHIVDPKDYNVTVLTQKIFRSQDLLVGNAINAAAVDRYLNDTPDTVSSVSLAAEQALPDLNYADIDVDTLPSAIKEIMDNSWLSQGEPVYCAISSKTARMLRKDTTVHNADFVRNYADLYRTGGLPQIDGVTFVVMPTAYMKLFTSALDCIFAWTPSAIANVVYSPFEVSTGISPDHRFDWVAYLRSTQDYKRIDDKGVVVGDIVG